MAGEWVPMRVALLTGSKVVSMALNLRDNERFRAWAVEEPGRSIGGPAGEVSVTALRYMVAGALIMVWGAAAEQSSAGFFPGITLRGLDEIAGIPAFGAAMARVGWAEEVKSPQGVRLPKFRQHNTPKKDRTNAERQRKYRAKRNAERNAVTVTAVTAPEKRREEYKKTPPSPPSGGDEKTLPPGTIRNPWSGKLLRVE